MKGPYQASEHGVLFQTQAAMSVTAVHFFRVIDDLVQLSVMSGDQDRKNGSVSNRTLTQSWAGESGLVRSNDDADPPKPKRYPPALGFSSRWVFVSLLPPVLQCPTSFKPNFLLPKAHLHTHLPQHHLTSNQFAPTSIRPTCLTYIMHYVPAIP